MKAPPLTWQTGIMALAFVGLLWAGIKLIEAGNGVVKFLGWTVVAAWVYIAIASPVGQAIWQAMGDWTQAATQWLAAVGRSGHAG
jgi:hypothetical protein